ncbi:hypothetical protein [Streptomyces sp. NPDC002580]|uniref:hypothetical protein n=1 Tax=Streptomyces sp. NPDC002580 TaxID=3364653 RepID=UPI0036AFD29A
MTQSQLQRDLPHEADALEPLSMNREEPHDGLGAAVAVTVAVAVAVGDATGDGRADVAVGAPDETVDSVRNIVLLKGIWSGLGTSGAQSFHQATAGVPGAAEAGDHFGSSLRPRDINRSSKADLAIGAYGEDVLPGGYDHEAAWLLRGGAKGLTSTAATAFSAKAFGYPVIDGGRFADTFGR